MGCRDCEQAQNQGEFAGDLVVRADDSGLAYYRWKNANIAMQGCDKHLREIFDVLTEYQERANRAKDG